MCSFSTFWAGFYTRQAYVQFFHLSGRLLYQTDLCAVFSTFRAGFYTRQAYVQFFHFSGRLLYQTGLCAVFPLFGQASIPDRLMYGSCAIISSIHSAEHACRESTSCVLYMTSHATHTTQCGNYKPRQLFKSSLCVGMQLQKCGFYSRAPSIQGRLSYKTLQ